MSRQIWLCRGSVAAAKTKSALAAVFDVAPHCIDAKLLQAEMMLDDKDYGGMHSCVTPLHLSPTVSLDAMGCRSVWMHN